MRRLTTLFAAICAIALGSCTSNDFEGITPDTPAMQTHPELTAGFDAEEQTKTYVDESKNLHWHEADQISAFVGNATNLQYQFKGATGDESGRFSYVSGGDAQASGLGQIYAVYPYDAGATITAEGVISLTLPATQSYVENSFGKGANPMVAVTENINDTFLPFKNICGYLKLNLYNTQDTKLSKLELKGKASEKIAGAATVTVTDGTPSLVMANDATTTVTIDCGEEGLALSTSAETATVLWLVLPEVTFSSGITITATATNGDVFVKSTNKEVAITRNQVQPMAVLEATFEEPKPANNEIWYTATEKVEPYNKTVFGANYVSNEWDSATGEGVITFDGDVTKIGDWAFCDCGSLTCITIPNSVTSIDGWAFLRCSSLTSITIPNSVSLIGYAAFMECTSLANIAIPNSVTSMGNNVFEYCSNLTNISLSSSITSIGECVFKDCVNLTSISIPNGVTSINWLAFNGCSSLINVEIPEGVTLIGDSAFKGCKKMTSITLPKSVTSIAYGAFQNCWSLVSVYCKSIVPPKGRYYMFDNNASGRKIYVPQESVEAYKTADYWENYADAIIPYDFEKGEVVKVQPNNEIWYTATEKVGDIFYGFGANCVSNKWDSATGEGVITFDGDITKISKEGFYRCSGYHTLRSIAIPNSVTSIEESAFSSCHTLTSVIIGNSVKSIGENAFYDCQKLVSIIIPNSVITIEDYAFSECRSLTSVTIGNSVKSIGENAFSGCNSLPSIVIPGNVTSIGFQSFENCINLTSVILDNGVAKIDAYAFQYCDGLTSITIPESVISIGYRAFNKCTNLTSVYCKATTPPTAIGDYYNDWNAFAFSALSRKFYVPTESVEAYKTAQYWKGYANDIVGYDF